VHGEERGRHDEHRRGGVGREGRPALTARPPEAQRQQQDALGPCEVDHARERSGAREAGGAARGEERPEPAEKERARQRLGQNLRRCLDERRLHRRRQHRGRGRRGPDETARRRVEERERGEGGERRREPARQLERHAGRGEESDDGGVEG
jgi:hypothetical protein